MSVLACFQKKYESYTRVNIIWNLLNLLPIKLLNLFNQFQITLPLKCMCISASVDITVLANPKEAVVLRLSFDKTFHGAKYLEFW